MREAGKNGQQHQWNKKPHNECAVATVTGMLLEIRLYAAHTGPFRW